MDLWPIGAKGFSGLKAFKGFNGFKGCKGLIPLIFKGLGPHIGLL